MSRVPLREGLLSSLEDEPRLLGGRCPACRALHFPATQSCPYCSAGGCAATELAARGTLLLFTAVEKAPPGYRGKVPYGFGVVELPEGIRLVTRLTEARPEALDCGMPVRLVFEELFVNDSGDTVVGWAFAPE